MSLSKRLMLEELDATEAAERARRVATIRAAVAAFAVTTQQLAALINAEACECESSSEVDELLDDWRDVAPDAVALVEADRWGGA